MKTIYSKSISYITFYVLIAIGFVLLTACSSGVDSTALARVSDGMKIDQVEALLGQPTRIEESEVTGATGKVYDYLSSGGTARVVFINDVVFDTKFIPEGKHA
jgi:outer membrane protein assembly factor BamE (lipoprotein component of BamABCDE complex)